MPYQQEAEKIHRPGVRDEGQVFIYSSDFQIDGVPVPYGPISVSTGLLEGTLETVSYTHLTLPTSDLV